ncbi:MAG: hypothetical protein EPN91_00340 [Salinibacterium sp.]|nr:MAG: hypothetical protein EPN91_00340 [Salinibacterium sp.]
MADDRLKPLPDAESAGSLAAPYDDALDALLVERGWTSMRPIKEDLYFDEWHWQPAKHPHPAQPTSIYCQLHGQVQVNLRYDDARDGLSTLWTQPVTAARNTRPDRSPRLIQLGT